MEKDLKKEPPREHVDIRFGGNFWSVLHKVGVRGRSDFHLFFGCSPGEHVGQFIGHSRLPRERF